MTFKLGFSLKGSDRNAFVEFVAITFHNGAKDFHVVNFNELKLLEISFILHEVENSDLRN